MSAELVPTTEQRLAFARALRLMGRLHDGRAPTLVCRGCQRPWPIGALDYAFAVDVAASVELGCGVRLGWDRLLIRHAPCGTLQAIPRVT